MSRRNRKGLETVLEVSKLYRVSQPSVYQWIYYIRTESQKKIARSI